MSKYILVAIATSASILSFAHAQACANGPASEINGNWYCQSVNAISYLNMGTPGSYNKIISMDDGQCGSAPQSYSGGIAPLDEEISWHFRGPLSLKQFAFYTPGSSTPKRDDSNAKAKHVGHEAFHKRDKAIREMQDQHEKDKREPQGQWVTATINGNVVSWPFSAQQAAATAQPAESSETQRVAPPAPQPSMNAGPGNWGRQAYYDADQQAADGLVFLNHNGGQGSGVWDSEWGNSLSYSSPDGTTGSANPATLADQMLGDNVEVIIMSDTACDDDCGAVRPGTVAYHGFEGAQKVFLFEFSMPMTGKSGFNEDMPAIWALNAQIPQTMQYGPADCSCWTTGCGEFDIVEILDSGNTRAKSTYHGAADPSQPGTPSGGDSNYFTRPTEETMKLAAVFDGDSGAVHLVTLPDDTSFDNTIPNTEIAGWVNTINSPTTQNAVFNLSPAR